MAGPTARVLLSHRLDDREHESVRNALASTGEWHSEMDLSVRNTSPIGGGYRGEGRPFLFYLKPFESGGVDELRDPAAFEKAFGFSPVQMAGFAAMCNGEEDHRILGELALWVAGRFGGIVDFNSVVLPRMPTSIARLLSPFSPKRDWEAVRPHAEAALSILPGRLLAIPYLTVSGRTWATHFSDAEFLRGWLAHRDFHMIK